MASKADHEKVVRLLLKAIRSLPQTDQDQVLAALLASGIDLARGRALSGKTSSDDPHLGEALGIWAARRSEVQGAEVLRRLGLHRGSQVRATFERTVEIAGPQQMVPVRFPEGQHARLKEWCRANGFSMAVVIRGLVGRFLDAQGGGAKGA